MIINGKKCVNDGRLFATHFFTNSKEEGKKMADSFDVEYLLRKRHNILENIFEYLDNQSLTTCREVSNSWKNFIDKRNYPWTRIVDKFYPKEVDKIGKEIMI